MNVLGAIGHLMNGSGIRNLLEVIYGENAVTHILTGKAPDCAVRSYMLLGNRLNYIIIDKILMTNPAFQKELEKFEVLYESSIDGNSVRDFQGQESQDLMKSINTAFEAKKDELGVSKTAELWFAFQRMMNLVRLMLYANRTGDWEMHLNFVQKCPPLFASASHYNYLKSAYHSIQTLANLQKTHPVLYSKFKAGYHVVRRIDKFWSGLGCDLTIEQTLMRSLKTSGRLTRGSGMSEHMRSIWTLSTPLSAEYNLAMQSLTEMEYTTRVQHKSVTKSRVERDRKDFSQLLNKVQSLDALSAERVPLINICTGIEADRGINVHEFEKIGHMIIDGMVGKTTFDYPFVGSEKARTMTCASKVKTKDGTSIVPALLFQRFIYFTQTGDVSMIDVIGYELCPYPTALFKSTILMLEADKPALATALRQVTGEVSPDSDSTAQTDITHHYVLDPGSLLRRIKWVKEETYSNIAEHYANFVLKSYSVATVAFDGYKNAPSVKDNTHFRRGNTGHATVHVRADAVFPSKRDKFLENASKKDQIIKLVMQKLRECGCSVNQAEGDADVSIVLAAVDRSRQCSCTMIGEHTDLLLLLLYYSNCKNETLIFQSDKKNCRNLYDIHAMKTELGPEVCRCLLFIYAFTGSDIAHLQCW